jgi:hypothetical protein
MSAMTKTILTGALFVLAAGSGLWLSHCGRPLGKLLSALHKLVSLGSFAVTAFLLFGVTHFSDIDPTFRALGIASFVLIAALLATGAILSGEKPNKALRAVHIAAMVLAAACIAAAMFVL